MATWSLCLVGSSFRRGVSKMHFLGYVNIGSTTILPHCIAATLL